MLYIAGFLLMPFAALCGTAIVIAGLSVVLGPAVRTSDLFDAAWSGFAFGCFLAAPVTLGAIPDLVRRYPAAPLRVITWGVGCGLAVSATMSIPILAPALPVFLPLLLLVSFAGGVSGGLAAAIMLLLVRAGLIRLPSDPSTTAV